VHIIKARATMMIPLILNWLVPFYFFAFKIASYFMDVFSHSFDHSHLFDMVIMHFQISLIDVPEYRRRKALALSPNIMRDVDDKVCRHYCLSNGFHASLLCID
jgi:hypothetical protein